MTTTDTKPKHSPTPWTSCDDVIYDILDADGRGVAECRNGMGQLTAPGNPKHIVRCVNAHDALVEALEAAQIYIAIRSTAFPDKLVMLARIRAALALAKGDS